MVDSSADSDRPSVGRAHHCQRVQISLLRSDGFQDPPPARPLSINVGDVDRDSRRPQSMQPASGNRPMIAVIRSHWSLLLRGACTKPLPTETCLSAAAIQEACQGEARRCRPCLRHCQCTEAFPLIVPRGIAPGGSRLSSFKVLLTERGLKGSDVSWAEGQQDQRSRNR